MACKDDAEIRLFLGGVWLLCLVVNVSLCLKHGDFLLGLVDKSSICSSSLFCIALVVNGGARDDGKEEADKPLTLRLLAVSIKDSRSSFGTLTSP